MFKKLQLPSLSQPPAWTGTRWQQEGADFTSLGSWNQTNAFLFCFPVIPDYPSLWCCWGDAVHRSDLLIMGQILQTSFSKSFCEVNRINHHSRSSVIWAPNRGRRLNPRERASFLCTQNCISSHCSATGDPATPADTKPKAPIFPS